MAWRAKPPAADRWAVFGGLLEVGETMIEYAVLVVGVLVCAYRAMRAKRILASTLYLACVSAMTAIMLYLLGAYQVAVIELSVGAGLVTVLLVYAISVVGDDATDLRTLIPRPLAISVALASALLVGWMAFSLPGQLAATPTPPLVQTLWGQRVLDVWIQMVLIFAGVLGILGLLAEARGPRGHAASQIQQPRTVKIAPPTVCALPGGEPGEARVIRDEVQV